jgi:hypothetical protein
LERLFGELASQGLYVVAGKKCPICVNRDGKFVAAAHRACGMNIAEARRVFSVAVDGTHCGPDRPMLGNPRRTGFRVPTLTQRELWLLSHGKVDWDDLLKRAEDLAKAMQGLFFVDGSFGASSPTRSRRRGNKGVNSRGRTPK